MVWQNFQFPVQYPSFAQTTHTHSLTVIIRQFVSTLTKIQTQSWYQTDTGHKCSQLILLTIEQPRCASVLQLSIYS